jgi:hypothetical protein
MIRMTGIPVLFWFVFVLRTVNGYADPAQGEGNCQCPCPCPEESIPEPSPDPEKFQDTLMLNQLVEVYEEVSFSHAEHAEMAEEGCGTCHHKTPVQEMRSVSRKGPFRG